MLTVAVSSWAQQPQRAAAQPVDWTKLVPAQSFKPPRLNNDGTWKVKTPRISGDSRHKEQEWGVFDYSFDTLAPWTDNLTATFYVFMDAEKVRDAPPDQPRFSFMQVTIRYSDIPKDKEHKISAVLLPAALLRYGQVIGLGCEVSVGDTVVYTNQQVTGILDATLRKALSTNPKATWWTLANIVDSPQTIRRNGYLVDRAKTPFAIVSIDDYEMSR